MKGNLCLTLGIIGKNKSMMGTLMFKASGKVMSRMRLIGGMKKESSPLSSTKGLVDLAGLSLPPESLRVITLSKLARRLRSLNNSSLTVFTGGGTAVINAKEVTCMKLLGLRSKALLH